MQSSFCFVHQPPNRSLNGTLPGAAWSVIGNPFAGNARQLVVGRHAEREALLMARRIVRFTFASLMVSAGPSGPGYSAL